MLLVIWAVVVIVSVFVIYNHICHDDTGFYIIGTLITLGILIALPIMIGYAFVGQQNAKAEWTQIQADEQVLLERRGDLELIIRTELDDYQEFELDVIESIEPEILLSYPQLTSNTVLVAKVEQLIAINEDLYNIQFRQNELQKEVTQRNNGALVPSFLVPDVTLE